MTDGNGQRSLWLRSIDAIAWQPENAKGYLAAPRDGRSAGQADLNGPFNEWGASVSPNGRWIAYVSDQSVKPDVWVARFHDGTDQRLVSVAGGVEPRWRGDGRELYDNRGSSIFSVAIESGDVFKAGSPQRLFEVPRLRSDPSSRSHDVAPDGRFLLNTIVERKSLPLTIVTDWRAGLSR